MKYLLLFALSFNCFGIDVKAVKKGESVPEDGFFVTAEEMKKLRQINEEKKILQEKVYTFEDLRIIDTQRVEFYKVSNESYQKALVQEQTHSTLKMIGGFILGSITTGATYYFATKNK